MHSRILVTVLVFLYTTIHISQCAIPRACSTPDTQNFPFCNTSLSIDERVDNLISLLQTSEKPGLLTARTNPAIARLGVPEYDWGANCVHGVQSRCGTRCPTSFPTPSALGASFNKTLYREISSIVGVELRALYLQGVGENNNNGRPIIGLDCWSPNININRDPRWGRNQEVASEDPYLNGQYGLQSSLGLQNGVDSRYLQAVITIKHWDAYSVERYNNVTRHTYNAVVSTYDFLNTYFPAFKSSVIDGKAKGVMCAYNSVNGVPACASKFLNDTLRGTWNFDGYITSDSGAISDIINTHHYVKTNEEAVQVALTAGTDINSGGMYTGHMLSALQQGLISEKDIDLALHRTFKLKFQLGLFDPIDDQPYWKIPPEIVNNDYAKSINLLSTRESIVLLKNQNNILPLSDNKNIAVIGPHGNAQSGLVGNYLGQICPGERNNDYSCIISPFSAISSRNKGKTVFAKGCDINSQNKTLFPAAVSAATASDIVVMFLGIDDSIEAEDKDRYSTLLPGVQNDLFNAISALGKPIIVVLINGGIVSVSDVKNKANGVLEAFYPGSMGGTAIADVIFGDYNPGGKLPVTIYDADYVNQVDFLSMDMSKAPGRTYKYFAGTPLWEFGYGLSYTSFTLQWSTNSAGNSKQLYSVGDTADYSVNVTNVGNVAGDEVVLAFFTPSNDPLIKRQLFGFERVFLKPQQSVVLTFSTSRKTFATGNSKGQLVSHVGVNHVLFTNGNDQMLDTKVEIVGNSIVFEDYSENFS